MEQSNQKQFFGSESIKARSFDERVYMEQVFETIDNEQLSDFLVKQLRPAGFKEEELRSRFYVTEDVTYDEESPHAAAWTDGKRINFEPKNFLKGCHNILAWVEKTNPSKDALDRDGKFLDIAKMEAVQTFIHEQLHHLTFTEYDYSLREEQSVATEIFTRRTGIERQVSTGRPERMDNQDVEVKKHVESRQLFRALNEGLTELMAQELTAEFVRQNPLIDDAELSQQIIKILAEQGAYKEERLKVEQLATVLAEMTEVTYDIMLKSFFHEYVTNGHLLPPEFDTVLAEYTPEGVSTVQLESAVAAFRRSLTVPSFNEKSAINFRLTGLINLMPKEKADNCKDKLAEIMLRYYPNKVQ